ncbi:hypothetical protein [Hymenobacter radiodurans]|uniref:hypothetical protein n=1 Tax=Hymenobacter radiodurans TaxID=2496028 RepID=UPI001058FC7C|nr:hypothetical protein [Hymenobacter radiodurans]
MKLPIYRGTKTGKKVGSPIAYFQNEGILPDDTASGSVTHWGNKAPSQLTCSNQLSYRQPEG